MDQQWPNLDESRHVKVSKKEVSLLARRKQIVIDDL